MARYEIPHLLLQGNMVFNYDRSFGQHEAFAISIENYTHTFIKTIMSPEYLQSIRAGKPVRGTLKVLRSKTLDIVDKGTRRKFLRSLMALGRYFTQRPGFPFPMRKYRIAS